MADKTLSFVATSDPTVVPLKVIDLGDGSYAMATSEVAGGSAELTLLSSASRNADINSSDQTSRGAQALIIFVNVTVAEAATTGFVVRVTGKDPVSGNYFPLNAAPAAITEIGQYAYVLGLGTFSLGGSVQQVTAVPIPRTWRVEIDSLTGSYTYSVGASVV